MDGVWCWLFWLLLRLTMMMKPLSPLWYTTLWVSSFYIWFAFEISAFSFWERFEARTVYLRTAAYWWIIWISLFLSTHTIIFRVTFIYSIFLIRFNIFNSMKRARVARDLYSKAISRRVSQTAYLNFGRIEFDSF